MDNWLMLVILSLIHIWQAGSARVRRACAICLFLLGKACPLCDHEWRRPNATGAKAALPVGGLNGGSVGKNN